MQLDLVDHIKLSQSDDPSSERFIVKKSELADVLHFSNLLSTENPYLQSFETFYNKQDLEMLFEISYFSVTVIDHKSQDEPVGIFVFNDTPFAGPRSEEFPYLRSQGLWEDWFHTYFEEKSLNGKNALWLTYFLLDERYALNEELQRRIYHKVHLSLYTTLNNFNHILLLLPKSLENLIPTNLNHLNEQQLAEKCAMISFKFLISYMYTDLKEQKVEEESEEYTSSKLDLSKIANKTNRLNVYMNSRISVFPTIEIRTGTQEDHDDLENIFKEQTPGEVMNSFYEDFFIAKMIAAQNEENKVLVGQVNDKAIGMLSLGTNLDVNSLIKSFSLDDYDNLLKQDYMNAVKLKRRKISSQKEKTADDETKELLTKYKREVMSCEKISQRIRLQEYIKTCEKYIETLEQLDKTITNKEDLTTQFALDAIRNILEKFSIKYPILEPFEKTIKINAGSCLLTDEFNFFIETLEFFGLPKGYMEGNGHWADHLQKEAERKIQREMYIKNFNKDKKKKKKQSKKENDEPQKPAYFDFSPLTKAMRLFKDANLKVRTLLRNLVKENKNLIASFFVNEEGEPSETKCFDIMSLKKKLSDAKIPFPLDIADMIGPIFLCFGNLPYQKRIVLRVPEEEFIPLDKIEVKKKPKATKKKVAKEEIVKKEVIPVEYTLYEVSISDFLKSLETSFEYDKLSYELGLIQDENFNEEYEVYLKIIGDIEKKLLDKEKSQFQKIKFELMSKNLTSSDQAYEKYSYLLQNYENENEIPPTPAEVLNAFCVKLFFIEQAFESRSSDFLIQAFDSFPDKDYMIITQPHSFFENSLLANFIKVEKKLDSLFGEVLYILHRESLMVSLLRVDFAKEEDLVKSAYLLENLDCNSAEEYFALASEAIRNSENSKFLAVTAKVEESNIGIFLLSKEINCGYYDSHFNIRDYSNMDKISKYLQGRVIFFLTHKNFSQMTNLMMKEIMRLCNKITLFYEYLPNSGLTYPIYLKDLLLLNNRRFPSFLIRKYDHLNLPYEDEKINSRTDAEDRDEFDEKESDFCLFVTTKKMLAEQKIANNNRVVVVGGSDTGISFIETLLSIRYLQFSYIYLISPGGLLYHHIEDEIQNLKISKNSYSIKQLQKLLFENRIKILNSKVSDIKPTSKYVQLEDSSIIPYDYLILTLGLQDKLHTELKNLVTNEIDRSFEEHKRLLLADNIPKENQIKSAQNAFNKIKEDFAENIISVDDAYLYSKFSPTDKKIESLKKNPRYEIILYGRSLNLLCFIQGLIKRGVNPQKIKLVIPNIFEHFAVPKEKAKKDQNFEELTFINGNSLEDTREVEDYLMENLLSLGVKLLRNFNFVGVNLNEQNDQIVSYKFGEDGSDNITNINASLIITGGLYDVDTTVFKFIHDNRLVYNGRAIIDKNFRTADRFIFAAGRLCEFSKAYTEKYRLMRLERYLSQ